MSSKRLSSEFHFAPQFKRHIGEPDVECVFNRKSVYDKTIEILFRGAKISQGSAPKLVANVSTNIPANATSKLNLKQMTLNSSCELEKAPILNRSKELVTSQLDKCAFCERLSCFTTLMECSKCKDNFCNNCSFPTNKLDSGTLCISCFK